MRLARNTALFSATLLVLGCGGGSSSPAGSDNSPTTPSNAAVSVSPSAANVRAGDSLQFTVSGSASADVTWAVNGTTGGSSGLGTISATGNYTAPAVLPNPNTVTISATSDSSSSATSSSAVALMNPVPALTGASPATVGSGNFSITINGNKFVAGAQAFLGTTALITNFGSSTRLSATGAAASGGNFALTVRNPDPGASTSNGVNLQVTGSSQASSCSQMQTGLGASLGGFQPFPSDSLWNKDISIMPVDSNSNAAIGFIGSGVGLHADFGAGLYQNSKIGIPYTVVGAGSPLIPISFTDFGPESDPGPMPIATTTPIEGDPSPGTGDRHVLVLENSSCFLYELYSSYPQTGSWNVASAAVWDLLASQQRPYTWTSADAAGLPIFPGLIRYDEVAAGQINHAIRFTLQNSTAAFIPPASHAAGNSSDSRAVPMGARFRLKANFDVSGFSAKNQVILNAMKKYGLIMADNGSSMYLSGAPDDRWDNDDLHELGQVTAGNFELLQMTPVYTDNSAPTGAAPSIASFTASSTSVSSGTPVTLSWQTTAASYVIVSPQVGVTRDSSVSLTPTATTTYTLYATNAFGRSKSTVTITVH